MGCEQQLIQILNDDKFHSGEMLASALGASRQAVRTTIRDLQGKGVDIYAVKGRGYRLAQPMEFLDQGRIIAGLKSKAQRLLTNIEIHQCVDSTNTYLMSRARFGLASGSVCLAEAQSAGRGRRGRPWVSPFGANLYLSLLWRFCAASSPLTGLSLATGIAVVRALKSLGINEVGLKWPNDVLWRGQKLGGILLEFGGETSGSCYVIAGVGINVAMPRAAQVSIDQPWVDLRTILGARSLSRNRVASRVINEMALMFDDFEHNGLATVSEQWRRYDLVAGQRIVLHLPTTTVTGTARGVDASGALVLETSQGIQRFMAGEVSVRLPK